MEIMKNYSDITVEIELIKEQIKFTEWELEYWFGIKFHDENIDGIPLASKGSFKYGTETALIQAQKKLTSLNKLYEQLESYESAKKKMDKLIHALDGLEYKIAYKRIVEEKTHQEIADELGYTHDYIRKKWSNYQRTHIDNTESIVKL
ncbi:hypothetical protein [Sediminibacillus massiliensis]|uniref:hypothetical protein n=1 Tax=Sediminibacillus massiliensis TaxID=1926277 RepID=UPI000988949F|nr:hypothetical protein [Sediminibacillus massiliensis]